MLYLDFAALIPFYDDRGQNSTCVLFKDGSKEYFSCSVKNYMTTLLYELHLDPHSLRFWTSQIIGTKLNIPFTIDEHHIFLPVKFRKPVTKQDGCFGYVSRDLIAHVEDGLLTFTTGLTLQHLSKKSYLNKKQKDAALLSYAYTDFKKQYEFMWKS